MVGRGKAHRKFPLNTQELRNGHTSRALMKVLRESSRVLRKGMKVSGDLLFSCFLEIMLSIAQFWKTCYSKTASHFHDSALANSVTITFHLSKKA